MTKRKGRIWTDEQKQKQAERIRSQKPWLKSTGPKSAAGKRTASMNAVRHGYYSHDFKMIRLYLKMQKTYIATLRFMQKHDLFMDEREILIRENELNETPIKSIQNDTFAHTNIVHFSQQKTRHIGRVFQNFQSNKIIQHQQLFRLPFS